MVIMRIKFKDIAKELNVSPATVSLAVNNQPGVKGETRKKILDYIDKMEMEYQHSRAGENKGTVMMLQYIKNGVILERAKGSSPVLKKMEQTVNQAGFGFQSVEFYETRDNLEELLKRCKNEVIKGIYILAAEMTEGDIYPFLQLKIPIVVGDNLFYEQGIDSFLIDNKEGICAGVDYLVDKGHSNIVYLAENIDIFNFVERRKAFVVEMARRECGDAGNRIHHLGNTVEEVYQSMKQYLDEGVKGTTAFILESSVISLGVSKALLERQIRIPRDISLIGFDALPPVSLLGIDLTLVKGTHTKRHLAAVKHLLRQIDAEQEDEIVRVYYKTRLLEGNSVFDKTKYIYH